MGYSFSEFEKKIDLSVFVLINNFDKYSRIFIYYLIDWTFLFFLLSLLYKSFAKIVKRKRKKKEKKNGIFEVSIEASAKTFN